MPRRPLCLAALLMVLWTFFTQKVFQEEIFCVEETEQTDTALMASGRTIRVQGEIYRQEKKSTNQIYLKNISVLSGTNQESYEFNIIIFTEEDTQYKLGNILEVTGTCREPEAATNPGQFDMAGWYQSQGIGLMMNKCSIRLADSGTDIFRQAIADFRGRISECFYRIAKEDDAALICAMLLGDKNGIDEEVKLMFQEGGISHVLAISGMHISMLGMLLFGLLRRLGLPFSGAGILSGCMMGIYCVMTGMSVSTARAFIMFLVYLGAQLAGRTYDLKSSLSLAVILLLFTNPLLLFQGGFQLSVLAVAGLAYLYPALKKRFKTENRFADSFLVSISIQSAIFPCLLYHYYQFSAVGILLNLLILPAMSALLLAGVVSAAAGLIFIPAGVIAFAPCHYILVYMETLCEMSLRIPGTLQIWGRPEAACIVLYYVILLGFITALAMGGYGCAVCGGLLVIGTAGLSFHPLNGLEMTFLDVGQGDGIFWQTDEGVRFLCDGGSSSVSQVGKYRLIPFLKCRGISRLDYLFVTHMDKDHISGVMELLESDTGIRVGCLGLPDIEDEDESYRQILEAAGQKGIPVIRFHDGMEMSSGQLSLECLAPEEGADYEDKNEGSIVLALQYGSFRALLTGDIQGKGEAALIENREFGKVSVLKVAHHGSKNSTPDEFLELAQPAVSVISCGKDNSYGHPSPELTERLEDAGSVICATMDQGAITVKTDGETFSVDGFYESNYD